MGGGEGEPGVLIFADLKLGFGTINRLIIHHRKYYYIDIIVCYLEIQKISISRDVDRDLKF